MIWVIAKYTAKEPGKETAVRNHLLIQLLPSWLVLRNFLVYFSCTTAIFRPDIVEARTVSYTSVNEQLTFRIKTRDNKASTAACYIVATRWGYERVF